MKKSGGATKKVSKTTKRDQLKGKKLSFNLDQKKRGGKYP